MRTFIRLLAILSATALLALSCGGKQAAPAAPAASSSTAPAAPAAPAATDAPPAAAPGGSAPAAPAVPGTAAPSAPAAAQPAAAPAKTPRKIGEITYAEGDVTIHRAGKQFAGDIGSVVESLDVIATGKASKAEIDLASGSAGGATLRLSENTAFYYDSAALDGPRETKVQLLAGAILVKVDKLSGGSFDIRSDNAALGVRGTEFIVNTIPDGSTLVTCSTGKVECVSSDGQKAYAAPGTAVEQTDAGLSSAQVPVSNLGTYRKGWVEDATAGFEKRALLVISGYAERYSKGQAGLGAAVAKLKSVDGILKTWEDKRAAGYEPRMTDWVAEKKQVGGILFDALKAMAALERPFFRLQELEDWHARGVGKGTLNDGRSSDAFFAAFAKEAASVDANLSYVRRALLLFKYASGDSPLGQFFGAKAEGLGDVGAFVE